MVSLLSVLVSMPVIRICNRSRETVPRAVLSSMVSVQFASSEFG
jgi:hypothetical protein